MTFLVMSILVPWSVGWSRLIRLTKVEKDVVIEDPNVAFRK